MSVTPEQLETLATLPASASSDAGAFTERSADDVRKLLDEARAAALLTGTNDQGGPKTPMRCVGWCRTRNPGAV